MKTHFLQNPNLYLGRKISKKLADDPNAKLSSSELFDILLDNKFNFQLMLIVASFELQLELFDLRDDELFITIGKNRMSYWEYKKLLVLWSSKAY